VGPGQLLDRLEVGEHARASAAVLLREGEREDVVLAQELDRIPGELGGVVDLGGARRDPLAGERAHRLDQHAAVVRERRQRARVGHARISSSDAVVIVAKPVAVTAYMFSIPTAPRPGNTNFGSIATTFPSTSGSSNPGARIGSSSISIPTPWPRNRTRSAPAPMKCSSRPASAAMRSDRTCRADGAAPGASCSSTARRIATATSYAAAMSAGGVPTAKVRV